MTSRTLERRRVLTGVALLTAQPALTIAAVAKPRVAIRTGKGMIVVELEDRRAPLTATNFLRYVDARKYDGGAFYRANRRPRAPREGSIVGGPSPRSHPYPPIAHESTTQTGLRHVAGTISLGRFDPGTATSDFFICASDEPYLDAHPGARSTTPGDTLGFAAFGHVVEGMAVVRKILSLPTGGASPFPEQKGQWLDPPVAILSMRRVG